MMREYTITKESKDRIAVTGACGLVGAWFCAVNQTPLNLRYDIPTHDITDPVVRRQIAQADVILNLAALSGIKACDDNPKLAKQVNEDAAISLAKEAKRAGARLFIQASTSSVYGETASYNLDESHPTNPRSYYGKTKLRAEKVMALADDKFSVVVLRKSNIYGCGMFSKPNTVIDSFLRAYLTHQPFKITGNGLQKRDFLHIMDIVRLYTKICKLPRVRSGVYNVGGNETISIKQLADLINYIGENSLGYRVPIDYLPSDSGMSSHEFKYDISKCQMEFNYDPIFRIDDYIKEHLFSEMRKP